MKSKHFFAFVPLLLFVVLASIPWSCGTNPVATAPVTILQAPVTVLATVTFTPTGTITATATSTPTFTPVYPFAAKWGSPGTGNGQFSNDLTFIALDPSGNVYTSDTNNNRVQVFSSSGAYVGQFGSFGTTNGLFRGPFGIAINSSGDIYVADGQNNRIQKFNSSGTYLLQWGSSAPATAGGNGQFNNPVGVAVDALGYVYVADANNNRVQKFDSNGGYQTQWGSTFAAHGAGNGQFYIPIGIAAGPSGNIYVSDSFNNRIEKFTSSGAYLGQWGSYGTLGNGQFYDPSGLATDSSENVFVVDAFNQRIQKFNSSGVYLAQWGPGNGNQGSGDGQFNYPTAIVIDPLGYAYVTDTNNTRVEVFAPH